MKRRIAFNILIVAVTIAVCGLCSSCDMIKGLFNKNFGDNIDKTAISEYADESLVKSISAIEDEVFDAMKTGVTLKSVYYSDVMMEISPENYAKEVIVLTREDIINALAEIELEGERDGYRVYENNRYSSSPLDNEVSRLTGCVANNALREYLKDSDITLKQLCEQEINGMTEKQEKAYAELIKKADWSRLGTDTVEDYMFTMWYEKRVFASDENKENAFAQTVGMLEESFETETKYEEYEYRVISKFDNGLIFYSSFFNAEQMCSIIIMTDKSIIEMYTSPELLNYYRAPSGK